MSGISVCRYCYCAQPFDKEHPQDGDGYNKRCLQDYLGSDNERTQ